MHEKVYICVYIYPHRHTHTHAYTHTYINITTWIMTCVNIHMMCRTHSKKKNNAKLI